MKTVLTGHNGETEEFENLLPSINVDERTLDLIDLQCSIVIADISLDDLKVLTFEP